MADQVVVLPKGVAIWPKLENPDTKFNPLGIYSVDVAVPFEEAEATMKILGETYKGYTGKAAPKAENSMWKMEIDEETGEETGRVIFKTKIKNVQRKDGQIWDRKPILWDAKGNRVKGVNLGSGSVIRVKASVYTWDAAGKKGVSLQPSAVQIIDLKTYSGGDEFDFEVEDGFVMSEDGFDGEDFSEDQADF